MAYAEYNGQKIGLNPDIREVQANYDLCKYKNAQLNIMFDELDHIVEPKDLFDLYRRMFDYIYAEENAMDFQMISLHVANHNDVDFRLDIDGIMWINPFMMLRNFQIMFEKEFGLKSQEMANGLSKVQSEGTESLPN